MTARRPEQTFAMPSLWRGAQVPAAGAPPIPAPNPTADPAELLRPSPQGACLR